MPWTTVLPIAIWAIIFIPLTVFLWIRRADSKLTAILLILDFVLASFYCYFSISWSVIDLYLEFIPLLLAILILFRLTGTRKWRKGPFLPQPSFWGIANIVLLVIILAGTGFLDYKVVLAMRFPSNDQVLLYFPERNGMYVIANGGNGLDGLGLNDSYQDWLGRKTSGDRSQAFSADIFKMSDRGYISAGILPSFYGDYIGYDDFVMAPCNGIVLDTEDGHPDVNAYARTTTDKGNYVVIECTNNYDVTLSNLKNQSVAVHPNQRVNMGIVVGQIGNSANQSIPHLHVYATKNDFSVYATPAPMLFDGAFAVDQFPIRNKIYLP